MLGLYDFTCRYDSRFRQNKVEPKRELYSGEPIRQVQQKKTSSPEYENRQFDDQSSRKTEEIRPTGYWGRERYPKRVPVDTRFTPTPLRMNHQSSDTSPSEIEDFGSNQFRIPQKPKTQEIIVIDDDDDVEFRESPSLESESWFSRLYGRIVSSKSNVCESLDKLLKEHGYTVSSTRIACDGNCQFSSVSDQFFGTTSHHSQIRREVMKWLKMNKNWVLRNGTKICEYLLDEDWNEFLERMSVHGQWGDELTLRAIAEKYRVNIVVISTGLRDVETHDGKLIMKPSGADTKNTIYLGFMANSYHYISIYPA